MSGNKMHQVRDCRNICVILHELTVSVKYWPTYVNNRRKKEEEDSNGNMKHIVIIG